MKSAGKNSGKTWAGFTLVEAILALVVVSIVVLSFNSLFRIQAKLKDREELDSTIIWHLFLSQLENTSATWEYRGKESDVSLAFLDVKDGKPLSLKFSTREQGNVIKIQKLNGYEPVLMQVERGVFFEYDNHVTLKVVMRDGKEFEADFYQWQKK